MKNIKSLFTGILICVVLYLAISSAGVLFDSIKEHKEIKKDRPTQTQIEQFELNAENKCYYYYNNLSDDKKSAYLTMYYGFLEYDESIRMEIQEEDIKEIFTAVLYDNSHIFWIDYKYDYFIYEKSLAFSPQYRVNKDEIKSIQESVDNKIDDIMTVVDTLDSDYEKEKYIHDYIIENTQYDISTLNNLGDTVYSVLVSGKSICEGYSRAVQTLLDEAGIDNYLVTGDSESDGEVIPHMWNVVNIDGDNYHLDVTWDDLNDEFETVYFYFNVTDEYISRDHYNIEPSNNNCVSTKENYFVKENCVVDTYKGFNYLVNQSVNALSQGNKVEFYFNENTDYLKAVNDIEKDNGFFNYVSDVVDKSKRNFIKNMVDYSTLDKHNYLCIEFKEG